MKTRAEEETKVTEAETAAWDLTWLQTERELTEISKRDEAEAVAWRNTVISRGRDVHRVTVRPERRPEYKKRC